MKTWITKVGFVLFLIFVSSAQAAPKKVVLVILENTKYSTAVSEPFLGQLANEGALLTNYFAIGHPSQPNYIAMVGGAPLGVSGDGTYNLPNKNLADLLEAKGLTWHVYAEGFPGNCSMKSTAGLYVRKHNPLISFTDISKSPVRCAHITDESKFIGDFKNSGLSNFNMYVPNLNNDGHDTGAAYADNWMSKTFGPILGDPIAMKDTLFITVFDEDDSTFGGGTNQIYGVLYGPDVKAGAKTNARYSHLSLLRTIEDLFQIGDLGQGDAAALSFTGIWK